MPDDDLRGRVRRKGRLMADADARAFLKEQKIIHAATRDAQGWPYVIPLAYIYEGADLLYVHTGASEHGHFLTNLRKDPRICMEVSMIGPLHPGQPSACDSALVYTSVVLFGKVNVLDDRDRKSWFLDRLFEKHGDPAFQFNEPGYPLLDHIVLYEVEIQILTGKRSEGLRH